MNPATLTHPKQYADWRTYFTGEWRMTRRIDDRRGARTGKAWGSATFAAEKGYQETSLACSENLTIAYGGKSWAAEQKTLWRFTIPTGPQLFFADGRFFCEAALAACANGWRAELFHDCGDDQYDGAMIIADDNNWRLLWRAAGPRKDYSLDTKYERRKTINQ